MPVSASPTPSDPRSVDAERPPPEEATEPSRELLATKGITLTEGAEQEAVIAARAMRMRFIDLLPWKVDGMRTLL
jgi:hypothetical protein